MNSLSELLSFASMPMMLGDVLVLENENYMACNNNVHEFVPCKMNNCQQCSLYTEDEIENRYYGTHCYPGKANRYCDHLQRKDKHSGHWKLYVRPRPKAYVPTYKPTRDDLDMLDQIL